MQDKVDGERYDVRHHMHVGGLLVGIDFVVLHDSDLLAVIQLYASRGAYTYHKQKPLHPKSHQPGPLHCQIRFTIGGDDGRHSQGQAIVDGETS